MDDRPNSDTEEISVPQAFEPGEFRALGHAVVDQLADFLEGMQTGKGLVRPQRSPAEAAELWRDRLRDEKFSVPASISSTKARR